MSLYSLVSHWGCNAFNYSDLSTVPIDVECHTAVCSQRVASCVMNAAVGIIG